MNEGINAIRLRPAMYIGSTSIKGFDHLLRHIVGEAFGYFKAKKFTFRIKGEKKGEFVISGLEEPVTDISFAELPGLRFDDYFDDFGRVVLNALSSSFLVEIENGEGATRTLGFEKGTLVSGTITDEPCIASCIRMTFDLDDSIFEDDVAINPYYYMDFLQTLGFLNKEKKIGISFDRDGDTCNVTYAFPNGLADLLEIKRLSSIYGDFYYPSYIEFGTDLFDAEIAFGFWENSVNLPFKISYVNNQISPENGVHLDAVIEGVRTSLNEHLRFHVNDPELNPISVGSVNGSLNCAVHIKMLRPYFEGSYRGKLLSPELFAPIKNEVAARLTEKLISDPIKAKEVITYLSRNATLNRR